MKPIDENERNSAAAEFQQSLEELEDIVKPSSTTPKKIEKPPMSKKATTKNSGNTDKIDKLEKIDLAAWEDAVADIEQYFQEKEEKKEKKPETPESDSPN